MMQKSEIVEASALVKAVLALLTAGASAGGVLGADLTKSISEVNANASTLIAGTAIGLPLKTCFDAAFDAAITVEKVRSIRASISGMSTQSHVAEIVRIACWRVALTTECRCLARMSFGSRQEIDAHLQAMNAAFDEAEELAGDTLQSALYVRFIALRGSVMRDLTERSRPLPSMMTLTFPKSLPSLVLAYRLYGDAARADELIAENSVLHPGFMPRKIAALVN